MGPLSSRSPHRFSPDQPNRHPEAIPFSDAGSAAARRFDVTQRYYSGGPSLAFSSAPSDCSSIYDAIPFPDHPDFLTSLLQSPSFVLPDSGSFSRQASVSFSSGSVSESIEVSQIGSNPMDVDVSMPSRQASVSFSSGSVSESIETSQIGSNPMDVDATTPYRPLTPYFDPGAPPFFGGDSPAFSPRRDFSTPMFYSTSIPDDPSFFRQQPVISDVSSSNVNSPGSSFSTPRCSPGFLPSHNPTLLDEYTLEGEASPMPSPLDTHFLEGEASLMPSASSDVPHADSPDVPLEEARRLAKKGERFLQAPLRGSDGKVLRGSDGKPLPGKIHSINYGGRTDRDFATGQKLSQSSVSQVLRGSQSETKGYCRPEGIPAYGVIPPKDISRRGTKAQKRRRQAALPPPPHADSPDVPLEEAQRLAKKGERFLQAPLRGDDDQILFGNDGKPLPGKIHRVNYNRRSMEQFAQEKKLDSSSVSQVLRGTRDETDGYCRPEGIPGYDAISPQDAGRKGAEVQKRRRQAALPPPPRADSPDVPLEEAQRLAEEGDRFLQAPLRGDDDQILFGDDGKPLPGKIHRVNYNRRSMEQFAREKRLPGTHIVNVLRGGRDETGAYRLPEGISGYDAISPQDAGRRGAEVQRRKEK